MKSDQLSQNIVISLRGESGSGKSKIHDFIIDFISQMMEKAKPNSNQVSEDKLAYRALKSKLDTNDYMNWGKNTGYVNWIGHFMQKNEKNNMVFTNLKIDFNGVIQGHGYDEIDKFTISGIIDSKSIVTFDKKYESDVIVNYKGTITDNGIITGKWKLEDQSDDFWIQLNSQNFFIQVYQDSQGTVQDDQILKLNIQENGVFGIGVDKLGPYIINGDYSKTGLINFTKQSIGAKQVKTYIGHIKLLKDRMVIKAKFEISGNTSDSNLEQKKEAKGRLVCYCNIKNTYENSLLFDIIPIATFDPAGAENITENLFENQIMAVRHILDLFGCCSTSINSNSSRYGKWTEIFVRKKDCKLVGFNTTLFTVEHTRVTEEYGMSNFHIFHMIFQCMSKDDRKEFG